MTTIEPFMPHPDENRDQGGADHIAAAGPGTGAPAPAPGFGVAGEEPDHIDAEPRPDVDPEVPLCSRTTIQ